MTYPPPPTGVTAETADAIALWIQQLARQFVDERLALSLLPAMKQLQTAIADMGVMKKAAVAVVEICDEQKAADWWRDPDVDGE